MKKLRLPEEFCKYKDCPRYRQIKVGEFRKLYERNPEHFINRCKENCLFSAMDYYLWTLERKRNVKTNKKNKGKKLSFV